MMLNFINRPPKVSVKIISETVDIMALIPPRESKASTLALPVLETKPDSIIVATLLNDVDGFSMNNMTIPSPTFNSNVAIAGTFRHAQTNMTTIGKAAHQVIEKLALKVAIVLLILPIALASDEPVPKMKYSTKETRKAGIVDHIKFLI